MTDLDPREHALDVLLVLPVRPRAKARPRFGKRRAYTKSETAEAEFEIAWLAARQRPSFKIRGPLRVDVALLFRRPSSPSPWWRRLFGANRGALWRPTRPDVDNLRKLVLDALASWWGDDAQVVDGRTLKVYAPEGEGDAVWVRLRSVRHEDAQAALDEVFGQSRPSQRS